MLAITAERTLRVCIQTVSEGRYGPSLPEPEPPPEPTAPAAAASHRLVVSQAGIVGESRVALAGEHAQQGGDQAL